MTARTSPGLAAVAGVALLAGSAAAGGYDDPHACSALLAGPKAGSLSPAAHRRCVIAVATTYIDTEENSIPPEQQLFADDVSRHAMGKEPSFQAGNAAKIKAEMSHSVIGAIKNRRWAVDGDQAWILYDGYLKTDPGKPGFYVAERLTVEKGLIKEILVASVVRPQ